MKAIEYVEKFMTSKDKDAVIAEIGRMFIAEVETMAAQRRVKTEKALIPIVKELNQKWMKFAEIINTKYYPVIQPIKYGGFLGIIKQASPLLFNLYREEQILNQ